MRKMKFLPSILFMLVFLISGSEGNFDFLTFSEMMTKQVLNGQRMLRLEEFAQDRNSKFN